MKILFFSPKFFPDIGGVETHVLEISKQIVNNGDEVVIITEHEGTSDTLEPQIYHLSTSFDNAMEVIDQPDISTKTKSGNESAITVYSFGFGKQNRSKKFAIWKQIWHFKKLIKNADVVHCHDVFFWYLPFRFLFPDKRIYTTFHGYETVYPPKLKAKLIRKLSEKLSRGNICVGDYIQKWYGTKADFVMYGGADKMQIEKRKEQKKNSKLKICFVGRISQDNGVKFYSEVLGKLKNQKVSFTFDAYGDGGLRKELEKFGRVHGFVNNVSDKLQEADIVFASSYLSMLQALMHKKLVVATYDNPLKRDYLIDSPFSKFILVEEDPEKVIELIAQENRKQLNDMIDKGYIWAHKQTWEKVANIYYKLWNVSGGSTPRRG